MPRPSDAHTERALRLIKKVLVRDFTTLIDMDDYEGRQPAEREKAFHSRALAALALRGVTGWEDDVELARCVIDGRDDHGIDAIAVSETSGEIWLVQSKWSAAGNAGFDQAAALKFVRGWRLLDRHEYDRFNERVRKMADRVRAVLDGFHPKVHFVIALTGPGDLHPDVLSVLDEEFGEPNGFGITLDHEVISTRRLMEQIRIEEAPEDHPIQVRMQQWLRRNHPIELYQGFVSADQVAAWYSVAGNHLFRHNIRDFLGGTKVNTEIQGSATVDPELFVYQHSGITVICDSLESRFPEGRYQSDPVVLTLRGASVIDGAQSVTSLHRALLENPEAIRDANVSVNVICTGGHTDASALATRITHSRNRQNRVEDRDFVSLDETQSLLREEFALRDLHYTYRRGEPDPAPEQGCSVVEAAVALACAHPNPVLAVQAKQNVEILWGQGDNGTYGMLFNPGLSASQTWGSVLVRRAVGDRLHQTAKGLRGRASDLADRGDLLLTHLVFQCVDRKNMDADDYDWDMTAISAAELTDRALPWLLHHLDTEYGSDSKSALTRTLADPRRCRQLATLTLRDLRSGANPPPISTEYRAKAHKRTRKARRPNSVTILLNAGVLADGTQLEYQPTSAPESAAVGPWLQEDPSRSRATWTSNRKFPLLWEADGKYYSPSGLAMWMYELAAWENAPLAVQGPARWYIDGEQMATLAGRIYQEMGEE